MSTMDRIATVVCVFSIFTVAARAQSTIDCSAAVPRDQVIDSLVYRLTSIGEYTRQAIAKVDRRNIEATVDLSVLTIKSNSPVNYPDSYWEKLRAIQTKYVPEFDEGDQFAFKKYSDTLRQQLSPASDADLKEMCEASELFSNPMFRRFVKNPDSVIVLFFAVKSQRAKDLANGWLKEMAALKKEYE